MIADYFRFALNSFRNRKLRTWLTLIGIIIGIAAVVSLVSIGQGMQEAINEEFKKVGSNRITVTPGGGEMSTPGTSGFTSDTLTEDDLKVIRNVKGVDYAIGDIMKSVGVKFKGQTKETYVHGVPVDSESIRFMEGIDFFAVENGRNLKEGDKYKAVVGYSLNDNFYDKQVKRGDTLLIKGKEFDVVGIYKKSGIPMHDSKVVILQDVLKELLDTDEFSTIFCTAKETFEPQDVVEELEKDLRKSRNVKEGEEDFTVSTAEQLINQFNTILNLVQAVLIGIAAISLLVGGIGIMTTMYTSVMERTREIGIMKAIGAGNGDVMLLFLIESGFLGVVGGMLGILMGFSMSKAAELAAVYYGVDILKAYMGLDLIIGVLIFSFIVGAVSGLMPARRASKMKPVDALRFG